MPQDPFFPRRSYDLDERLQQIETYLSHSSGRQTISNIATAQAQQVASSVIVGSGGGTSGSIPESRVTFDPTGGHNHDGAISRKITLLGDVTGFNTADTVVKIQSTTIAAPVAGDDQRFIKFVNALTLLTHL